MKIKLIAAAFIAAMPGQTTQTKWGPRIHRPNAVYRAMLQRDAHHPKDVQMFLTDPVGTAVYMRDMPPAMIKLQDAVAVTLQHSLDNGALTISIRDVDGNESTLWLADPGTPADAVEAPLRDVSPY